MDFKPERVYAILDPEGQIVCLHPDKYRIWYLFFSYGNDGHGYRSRAPLATAIEAYESIGYKKTTFRLVRLEEYERDKR